MTEGKAASHSAAVEAHLVHQRLEFAVAKIRNALGCALVEQFFFQVGIDAVGDLAGRFGDGLHHALEVNVLVLQLVDHIVKAGLHRGVPAGGGLPASVYACAAETNVGVGGVR